MGLGYAGEWPSTRLTCGRLRSEPTKSVTDKLERKMRRAENIDRKIHTNTYGKDAEFEFESHRPFWNDEWEIDLFDSISLTLVSDCNDELFNDRLRLFQSYTAFRRVVGCEWGGMSPNGHQAYLTLFHDINDVYGPKSQEMQTNWVQTVRFEVALEPVVDAKNCAMMRDLAVEWDMLKFIDPPEAAPGEPFRINIPSYEKRFYSANRTSNADREDFPCPVLYKLRNINDTSMSLLLFSSGYNLLKRCRGPASVLKFHFNSAPSAMSRYAEACRSIKPVWDSWTFSGNYRKSFDPFARPENLPPGEVRVYPIINYSNAVWDNAFSADKLFLRASVIHTHDESFIELQTSEGKPWLEKTAEYAGCQVDIWDGPIEKRWGLYS